MPYSVPFTQYLRPNGEKRDVATEVSDDLEERVKSILDAGFVFECEELSNGFARFTISDDNGDYSDTMCPNGPLVPGLIDTMIRTFNLELAQRQAAALAEANGDD